MNDNNARLAELVHSLPLGIKDNVSDMLLTVVDQLETFPGSIKYHHRERGGWLRHVLEVYDIAVGIARTIGEWPDGITSDDIFLGALLHDFAKLVSYRLSTNNDGTFEKIPNRWKYMSPEVWTIRECGACGIYLSDEVVNAVLMAEGGWSAFARENTHSVENGGSSTILAAIIHAADLVSATKG